MAYDAARARTVLFGGLLAGVTAVADDTWLFDGAGWTPVATPTSPQPRSSHALAYDAVRGRTLLFGSDGGVATDTWAFDGADWQKEPVQTLRGAWGARLAYDSNRQRAVLYGGVDVTPFHRSADGWLFAHDPQPTWTRHGSGCAGSNGTPTLDAAPGALPALGAAFALRLGALPVQPGALLLVFGTDFVAWNGALLPVRLGPLGMPACQAWLAPAGSLLIGHAGSTASTAVGIPASPALAGLVGALQAAVLDAAAPGGIGSVSNAGILRVY
jgi:hypothetical protein